MDVLFYLQCTLCLLPCVGFQCITVLCNVVPYTPGVCPCLCMCSVWYGSENTFYNGPCFVSIDELLCVYLYYYKCNDVTPVYTQDGIVFLELKPQGPVVD